MSSAPLAAPIRQPRGPSANAFGNTSPPDTSGPPAADTESSLRRANSASTPRHHASASISSAPAASSAFHGSKFSGGPNRFRSGSLSSGQPDPGLVRKGSGRAVRKEEAVPESGEEGITELGSWGKGLSRQSSLPSRRGFNPVAVPPSEPVPPKPTNNPPPRPPRRISVAEANGMNAPSLPSTHSASHSLSSLTMFSPPGAMSALDAHQAASVGANVSRTQSLRAQAKHTDVSGLGRSASMKAAGEHHRPPHATAQAASPPTLPNTPHHPFTPPSPPPQSSAAAFPPFQLPNLQTKPAQPSEGADIRRHQSLTQGYGSSNRVRDRLERSPAVLTLDQRRLGDQFQARKISEDQSLRPPTSPIGPSVWSPSQGGDDGWHRPATQQIQDAFQAMNLGFPQDDNTRMGQERQAALISDVLRQPQPQQVNPSGQPHHIGDEPSWVANLVGNSEGLSPQPVRSATAPNWQERESYMRGGQPGQPAPSPWLNQSPYLGHPFAYLPQQQMAGLKSGTPVGFPNQLPGYMQQPFYPSPPGTAPLPGNDADVIELAKSKGLNPATFDCRPVQARFFVIKSYTEDDVQKSLKHEIWSSTVLGNKRLNSAYQESADKMPIYLFFSVNGSRHFNGVAQMISAVDDNKSSTVWKESKWKGLFSVKWIFVRDIPTSALRHIRLLNTPEQKPITNSRDTQELHYEAGCEVLSIFLDWANKSKTSLLQDFAYYERMSTQRPSSAGGFNNPPGPPAPTNNQPSMNFAQAQPGYVPPGGAFSPPPPVPAIPARFR